MYAFKCHGGIRIGDWRSNCRSSDVLSSVWLSRIHRSTSPTSNRFLKSFELPERERESNDASNFVSSINMNVIVYSTDNDGQYYMLNSNSPLASVSVPACSISPYTDRCGRGNYRPSCSSASVCNMFVVVSPLLITLTIIIIAVFFGLLVSTLR